MTQPIQVFDGDGVKPKAKAEFPVLYYRSKTGALHQWRTWPEGDTVWTEHGQVNGKLQTSSKMAQPTNVGRSNHRDSFQQAVFEAQALWEHKVTRRYREDPAQATEEEILLPMLAQDGKKVKKLTFPLDLQSKFDGLRCMAMWEGEDIKLMSRSGRYYDVPHIAERLKAMMPRGVMLDGEIYVHGVPFQTVTSLIKRNRPESAILEYHCYDCPDHPDYRNPTSWSRRRFFLQTLFPKNPGTFVDPVKLVGTVTVNNIEMVKELHDKVVQHGYEGVILRLHHGTYEFARRSNALLKWKEFDDAEFTVVGVKEGEGKMAGHAIFLCKNDSSEATFDTVCRGTMDLRKEWWVNRDQMVGKTLTVRFFGRSEDKIPRFPVGVGFRDAKDLPRGDE